MKKVIKHILIVVVLVCLPAFISSIYADAPPDPGGGPGGGDPPVGGAPIGGGIYVMAILALSYGIKKYLFLKKKVME